LRKTLTIQIRDDEDKVKTRGCFTLFSCLAADTILILYWRGSCYDVKSRRKRVTSKKSISNNTHPFRRTNYSFDPFLGTVYSFENIRVL
jgi:hypothetical protein